MGGSHERSRRRRSRSHSMGRSPDYRRGGGSRMSEYRQGSVSRSRSPRRSWKVKRSYSRSRSASRSPDRRRPGHLHYESPPENECLGVFNLNPDTTDRQVDDLFSRHGRLRDVTLIYDRMNGRSRGFGFVTFERLSDAREARNRCNGVSIDGRTIRVDFSATQRPHTPTPGMYMGKPSDGSRDRGGGDSYDERWGRSSDERWGRSNDDRWGRSANRLR